MTNEEIEYITKLIEKPPEDIRITRKRSKKYKEDKAPSKLDTCSNHRKQFHQKIIYNKPWTISKESCKIKKEVWYEKKILANEKKPILLPIDPAKLGRKNFRLENVRIAKLLQPPIAKQRYVDNRNGDSHDLVSSGLLPIYMHRKQKIPKYLRGKRIDNIKETKVESEENDYNQFKNIKIKGFAKSKCKHITPQEREELLLNMKRRWDQLMSEFQTLPFIISTPPQIKRKSTLENALKQLEKDIETIERHKLIFVYDDNVKK